MPQDNWPDGGYKFMNDLYLILYYKVNTIMQKYRHSTRVFIVSLILCLLITKIVVYNGVKLNKYQ